MTNLMLGSIHSSLLEGDTMSEGKPQPKAPEDLAKAIFRNADRKLQGESVDEKPSL